MAFRTPSRGIPNVVDLKFNVVRGCLITLNGGIIELSTDTCDEIKAVIDRDASEDSPVAGPAGAPAPRPRPRRGNNALANRHHPRNDGSHPCICDGSGGGLCVCGSAAGRRYDELLRKHGPRVARVLVTTPERDLIVAGLLDAPAPRPSVIPCLDESNCNNVDCEKHHLNSVTDELAPGKFRNMKSCNNGAACQRPGCFYNHK